MDQKNRGSTRGSADQPAQVTHLLEQVCRHIVGQMGASSCALSHYDPAAGMVVTWITYAQEPAQESEQLLEVGESYHLDEYPATKRVLLEQTTLCVQRDDPQADAHERAYLEQTGQRTLLMVPLLVEDRTIGLLELYQRERACDYTPEEIELARALAGQAALVIAGGHLFEVAWQEARDLTALMESNAVVVSSLDLETVLRRLAEHLARLIAVEECVFSRWQDGQETLSTWVKYLRGETTVWSPGDNTMVERLTDFPLTARVLHERVPIVVQRDDSQADPAERALLEEVQMHSLLMLPVVAYDRVVGLVELREGRQRREFTPREIALAQALANQAAVAVENARLFREREQRLAELSILNTIGQAISAPLDLNSLLETVHHQVGRIFDATNFYIALYEEGADTWAMGYQVERGERQPSTRHELGTGITSQILRTRRPLLLRSLAESSAWHEAHGVPPLGEQSKSWMGVPMLSADKLLGVMAIQSYEQESLYDEQDLALFSTIATQVANAVDNIRLLEETRRRAQEMETINEVGAAITSVLDLDTLLKQIVEITQTRFGYYFCCAALVERDAVVFRARSAIGTTGVALQAGVGSIPLQAERSLVAEAARTGRPVVVNDVRADPHYLAVAELPDTRAELDVPILFQDRVLGVLDVQSDREGAFGEQEVALLQALVSQAGVAIANAQLFQERGRQITALAIVNEIGQRLSAALQVEDVTRTMREQIGRIFRTDNFYVALYDEAAGEWETVLDIINGQPQPPIRRSVREGLTGYLIRTRQPLLFRSAEESRRFRTAHAVEAIGEPAASWMGAPMIAADRVVGIVATEDERTTYSADDLAVLSTVASQAAIAIQNARLFRESQQRAEQLNTLLQQVRDMSTPVIPLQDRVLVLPLVGTIDSGRARDLTDRLLEAVRQTRALVILLDITGVPVVDTAVAQAIIQAANAARLLGAEVVLVGVRSEVAQTLVTLGVSMEGLVTKSNLQAGIAYALGLVGLRIVPEEMVVKKR